MSQLITCWRHGAREAKGGAIIATPFSACVRVRVCSIMTVYIK